MIYYYVVKTKGVGGAGDNNLFFLTYSWSVLQIKKNSNLSLI